MRKLLKRRGVKIMLELGIFVLVYFGIRTYIQRHLVTGAVPAIKAETLAGKPFDSSRPRQGPLLIHFWASWCPICHLEQRSIQAISHQYPVISIAMNSGDATAVRQFMQKQGLDFPVINDPEGEIAKRFGVIAVPVSFVIDRKNHIRFVERGYTTEWGLRLRLWWSS